MVLNRKHYFVLSSILISYVLWIAFEFNSGNFAFKIAFYLLLQTTILVLLLSLLPKKFFLRFPCALIAQTVLIVIPCLGITYFLNYGSALKIEDLNALLQTNTQESLDYVKSFLALKSIVFFLIVNGTYLFLNSYLLPRLSINRKGLILFLVICSVFFSLNMFSKNSKPNFYRIIKTYFVELSQWREVSLQRKIHNDLDASKKAEDEIGVLVIGESLNRNHMGLYGYFRDTTPYLDKRNDLIVYKDVLSSKAATNPSISDLLTTSRVQNTISYHLAPSFIEYLNKTGTETLWLSNQIKFGLWDNHVSVLADSASEVLFINNNIGTSVGSKFYDEKLLEYFAEALDTEKIKGRNKFIIIHLMGSHGNYCDRFPSSFKVFKTDNRIGFFGTSDIGYDNLDCYDNSIRYNDFVMNQIIEKLNAQNKRSFLVYVSDHSENIIEGLNHSSSSFVPDIFEIPMIVWFSPQYRQTYPEQVNRASEAINRPFMTDDLIHVLFDLYHIDTPDFISSLSLINDRYVRPGKRLLYGTNYDSEINPNWVIKQNLQRLSKMSLKHVYFAHRVNSIGKFSDALNQGINHLEMDVYYDEASDRFRVGHDLDQMAGLNLDDYLEIAQRKEVKSLRLWIDLKNYSSGNSDQIYRRITKLVQQYRISRESVLETMKPDEKFARFSNLFHTAYYLPKEKLERGFAENEFAFIQDLISTMDVSKVKALSFDSSLYDQIRERLSKSLPDDISYLTWDLGLSFTGDDLIDQLKVRKYYSDKHLKYLIISYPNHFNL